MPSVASANAYVGGGWTSSSSNITGAKCDIYTAAYGVLTSPHFTCVWPMVTVAGTAKYTQVGWAVDPDFGTIYARYFYQSCDGNLNNAYEAVSWTGPAWNTWHNYSVLKNGSGYWVGKADDAVIGSQQFSMSPNRVEYYNENDSSSTQYIGTSDNKLEFAQVYYYDGSWKKPSLSFSHATNSSIDTTNWSSNGYWYSWDSRY